MYKSNCSKISGTQNVAAKLELKYAAKIMLTSNVNLEDRPVNVLLSKKVTFYFIDSAIKVKDVKLNDINAAKVIM